MAEPARHRVEEIFQRAADLPLEAREALLHSECGGDAALSAAVDRLLRIHDRGLSNSLRTPLFATFADSPAEMGPAQPARIGRYAIVRKLGGR